MSTPDIKDICKDKSTKADAGICEVNDMLQNMSTADDDVIVCANCGKKGSDVTNICNKCKSVMYCNAVCKKKHRQKHKKECERRVSELHDEELFKQPPPKDDCPICFIRLPSLQSGSKYMSCCGKTICSGCCHAPVYDNQGNIVADKTCPFCRTLFPTSDEDDIKRYKIQVEANDANAIYSLGCFYRDGTYGLPQDYNKALELSKRAAELDHAGAYGNIGNAYFKGNGVEVDEKKAIHCHELAAMMGNEISRYNMGLIEKKEGNVERAFKHWMIAVNSGASASLDRIKHLYTDGHVTKEDYMKALQLYQAYLVEIKSDLRDKAAAAHKEYRYY